MRRPLALVLALAIVVASCGDDDTTSAGDTTSTSQAGGPSSTSSSTTAPPPASTTSSTAAPSGELPGERIEIFPYEGAELAVVGVAVDDTLNVRSAPGTAAAVVFELEPLETGFTATGHNRNLASEGFWAEVAATQGTGWVNVSFVAQLGRVVDITTEIAPTPADRPRAETMLELGQLVADARASQEPPSDIVVVDGPTVGDLGEITVDVIGLGDDAVAGERLHVFAEPDPGGEGFTLRTVEATTLCSRGVTDDGLCV